MIVLLPCDFIKQLNELGTIEHHWLMAFKVKGGVLVMVQEFKRMPASMLVGW